MDIKLYSDIVSDIKNIRGLNVNDTYFSILSSKYPSVSEETLRSIINLWFQRKITQIAFRVKDVKIYDLYRQFIECGMKDACWQIAHQLDYPPSLIAKIVLTNYLAEVKAKKTSVDPNELKILRKQLCPLCKLPINISANIETTKKKRLNCVTTSAIKKHHDPRVELALNLFDDDNEIEKYFLSKFTFSNNKAKKCYEDEKLERKKSSKFFWQASRFEEMGEKNVKKFANVEKFFNNRLGCDDNFSKVLNDSEFEKAPNLNEKHYVKAKVLDFDVTTSLDDIKLIDSSSCSEGDSVLPENENDVKECLSNIRERVETKICSCGSPSASDNSDTDGEDSDESYENISVKELFENPSLIEDPVLARDVLYCISFDDQYGPTSDVICSSSGITHEKLLEEYVKNVGLAYKTENKLRGDGFDKTPDIILLVPVAVKNFVINWIESKAQFADFKLHQDFEKRQFQNYVNRFGPGLVIYWHGYVNEVLKSDLVNKQIIINDRFPSRETFTFVKSDKFKLWMQSK